MQYNDVTNAFKAYKRTVIEGIKPLNAKHFNLSTELALKAITRGYTYAIIPINWYGRKTGTSKMNVRKMTKKYLHTILSIWLEKLLLKDEIIKK